MLASSRRQGEAWGLVFPNTLGGPLDACDLVCCFKGHLRRAGLPDIRFHDLRHSCASLLVAQRVNPRMVMEILGHSQVHLTMNTYAHVLPEAQREALAPMDKLFPDADAASAG